MFTIAPPPLASRSGIAARQILKGASKLIVIVLARSSSVVSVMAPRVMMPALFTTMSSPPSASCAALASPSA